MNKQILSYLFFAAYVFFLGFGFVNCGNKISSVEQIVISNTFSTSRHVLQDAGFEEHFEVLKRRGIELAR